MKPYFTVYEWAQKTIEVKKSKFIANIFPVSDEYEVNLKISEICKQHYSAAHNCSAYILGVEGLVQRFDDDGEPGGTAGIPMLEVLKKRELRNVLTVVTRYFGGIKLGASGLMRAYGSAVTEVLESSIIVERTVFVCLNMIYDYVFHGKIMNYVDNEKLLLLSSEFSDKVNTKILIRQEEYEKIRVKLYDICSGKIKLSQGEPEYRSVHCGKILER